MGQPLGCPFAFWLVVQETALDDGRRALVFNKIQQYLHARRHLHRTPEGRLVIALRGQRIDCVIDVGANIGQTGLALFNHGFDGRVLSFEPTSQAYKDLSEAARAWPNWSVAPQMALGAAEDQVEINLAVTSNWSSIKTVRDQTVGMKPKSRIVDRETIDVKRLDQVVPNSVDPNHRLFVKIDTQGYEAEVLEGCDGLLPSIFGFQLELSLLALYEGEKLYDYHLKWMEDRGYELWMVEDVAFSAELGRQLQFDAVFFKPDELTA